MIKRLVSKQIGDQYQAYCPESESRQKRGESAIWQRRFWEHHILNDADYVTHLNYCYWNPVKHGLVRSVKDWEYSTFHRDVKRGVFPFDWCSNEEFDEGAPYGESVRKRTL